MNRLADEGIEALSLILSAHAASWNQRSKSGVLRRHGREEKLESLDDREAEALVSLIRAEDGIRKLLDPGMATATREEQLRVVKQKSTANMFVALKYLFASDGLDSIVLEEFAQLDETFRKYIKWPLSSRRPTPMPLGR